MSLKHKAVEYAQKTSKEMVARHFGANAKRIWDWSGQIDELASMTKGPGKRKRKQLHGAGQKALDTDMEEALFSWIVDLRGCNLCVSCKNIHPHSRSSSTVADFKASIGRLRRFMKRHSLSI